MAKKSTGLLKKRNFRKRDLIFVAALFSLIGMIAIISSFAASFTTLEAESLKYSKVSVVAGQAGGKAAGMFWSGTGTGTVQLPTKTTKVTVYAKGDQCKGAPQLTLSLNGRQVANQQVASTGWKAYEVPVNLEAGNHSVVVGFTNDAVLPTGEYKNNTPVYCDRNLYVDRLVFAGLDRAATINTVVESETMSSPLSRVVVGSTKEGKARVFYQNANATASIVLPTAATQLKVVAKGDQCQGAPNLRITVDGKTIMSRAITGKNWGEYSSTVTIPSGSHKLEIAFTNDVYIAAVKCDRNLYVDRVILTGLAPTPAPTPTPPASVTPAPTKPTTPAAQPVVTYNPAAPNTIIMIGWRPYDKEYTQLANTKTNLVFRAIERGPNAQGKWPKLDTWEAANYRYYNNVAGSDWASSGPGGACKNLPLAYMDQSTADQVLNRKGNIGYYMHEMVALYAACNGWNWTRAAESMNWAQVHHWMMQARTQGKKVIWSEPAQGWSALSNNPSFQAYSVHWKDTLVPMFATNFRTPAFDHVPAARASASEVARRLGTPVGASIQSWYFREGTNDLSIDGTVRLANYSREVGTTYYQIEGTWGDMTWGSDYMKGILAFSKLLGPAGPPGGAPPIPVTTPKPQPPALPTTAAKKPLHQLWNAAQSNHLYTTNETEKNQLMTKGYVYQGITGYLYEKQVQGSVPLYRLYSGSLIDHFYTNSETQRSQAKAGGGKYVDEGIVGYIMSGQAAGTTPLYQLYSSAYPDHFYTAQGWERTSALASFRRYVDRGNAGYIFTKP